VALHGGKGTLAVDQAGRGVLVVRQLQAAPANRTYEAWVIPPGSKPIKAGLFRGGEPMTMLQLEQSVPTGSVVAATVEPVVGVDGYVYAADGHTILAVLRGSQSRVLVPSDRINAWMKQAIVATEDRRFYEHRGIDIRGMGRALLADIEHKSAVQGGSTITQQFVKNELTGADRSITRKLKEATLAWQLERVWSKDQILTAYLNTIYFANGAYGVERAARTYFGHDALKLTLPEAALLAGIPADPSRYDPVAHPRAATARRATVL